MTDKKEQKKEEPVKKPELEKDVIYVGDKPALSYVSRAIFCFNEGLSKVRIRARGSKVSKAIGISEMLKRSFMPNLKVKAITGSEIFKDERGQDRPVVTIELVLTKGGE